ncbi:MAG: hypothetical protein KJO65_05875 [Gemmatimonadetes bacterium]|nr:hypothetical protein [Gemmatimonadota bacterium]
MLLRLRPLLVLALIAAGCVTVSKSVLMDRSSQPVPKEDVTILLATDSVPSTCDRVALLHASGDEGFTDEADIWNKLREEAGKLGANAVQIQTMEDPGAGERFAGALFGTEVDRDSDALALWCPEGVRRPE